MSDERLKLREAVNVADLKQRDALVRRVKKMRADAVLGKATIEWFNAHRLQPGEAPISTDYEVAVIAWCDGKGPFPTIPTPEAP
jgi:hypothetical protein